MLSIIHLSNIWEHTLNEILTHDIKSEVGIIMRSGHDFHDLNDLHLQALFVFTKRKQNQK